MGSSSLFVFGEGSSLHTDRLQYSMSATAESEEWWAQGPIREEERHRNDAQSLVLQAICWTRERAPNKGDQMYHAETSTSTKVNLRDVKRSKVSAAGQINTQNDCSYLKYLLKPMLCFSVGVPTAAARIPTHLSRMRAALCFRRCEPRRTTGSLWAWTLVPLFVVFVSPALARTTVGCVGA